MQSGCPNSVSAWITKRVVRPRHGSRRTRDFVSCREFQQDVAFGYEDGQSVGRAEVYVDTGDREENKAIFDALLQQREAIEAEFGDALIWARRDDVKHSRIYVKRPGALDDPAPQLDEYREWFIDHALRFRQVFGARIRELPVTVSGSESG